MVYFVSVPAPRQLTLERQLNKSILIGWTPPDCPPGQIEMYHVYVDGFLRTTVRATDKTKALVEGVDNARVSNSLMIKPVICLLNLHIGAQMYHDTLTNWNKVEHDEI